MGETTQRVLRLLDLLQSRSVWTGPELADRLGVTTWRFRAREHPDPVEFVGRSVSSPYPILAKVRVLAPYDDLTAWVTPTSAHVTRLDADSCLLETGAGNVYALAFHLAWLGFELEVLDPPELRTALGELGARMARAAGRVPGSAEDAAT